MRISIEGPELAAVDFHEALNIFKSQDSSLNIDLYATSDVKLCDYTVCMCVCIYIYLYLQSN